MRTGAGVVHHAKKTLIDCHMGCAQKGEYSMHTRPSIGKQSKQKAG